MPYGASPGSLSSVEPTMGPTRHREGTAREDERRPECCYAGVTLRRQNVLMNSIKARLSSSLNTGSVPNAFSSSLRPSVSLNFAVPK